MNIITNPKIVAARLYESLKQSESTLYDRILYTAEDALIDDCEIEFLTGLAAVDSTYAQYTSIPDLINNRIIPRMASSVENSLSDMSAEDYFPTNDQASAWINTTYVLDVERINMLNTWLNAFETREVVEDA